MIDRVLATFQTQLERKMSELNPQAQELIARFSELEGRRAAATGGGA